jgi:hypothetical protein
MGGGIIAGQTAAAESEWREIIDAISADQKIVKGFQRKKTAGGSSLQSALGRQWN